MNDIARFFAIDPGWAWLVLAAILFALDVLAPGFYVIWFAIAAGVVGVIVFAVPMSTEWQILVFCAVSVASLMIGRALFSGRRAVESDKPLLNQRARQLIGRTFVLATPIHSGRGRIAAGDGMWIVKGPDLPAGVEVLVIDTDGTLLIVEKV
jgi:membrane protein implicated in regulation of membrane protease activity